MIDTKKPANHLRVLGVDPGTATTGWAVVEITEKEPVAVAYGAITTDKNKSEEKRLVEISADLEKIVKKYRPAEAAVETIFFFKNQKTVIEVSQARGAILLTLSRNNCKIASYTPLQIKQALTSYGRADKHQVQEMTKNILGLKSIPRPDDAADAIAVAICHINSRLLNKYSNQ